jgi:ABC-type enterochelin transport system substrate-binding protein
MNAEQLLESMEQRMRALHKAMDEQEKTDALIHAVDELIALIQPLGDSAGSPVRAAIKAAIARIDAAKDAIDQYRNLPVEASS